MTALGVVFALTLVAICSALDYTPVFYPGPCPKVPPSSGLNQKDLIKQWYPTFFSNPSFKDGIRCATLNLTESPNGLQFKFSFLNASDQQETYKIQLNATRTPGLYDVYYVVPNGYVHGKQVFYLHDANEGKGTNDKKLHVLSWSCIDGPERKQHVECAGIQSQDKTTPLSAVQVLQTHLKSHGSSVEEFYQINNANCPT